MSQTDAALAVIGDPAAPVIGGATGRDLVGGGQVGAMGRDPGGAGAVVADPAFIADLGGTAVTTDPPSSIWDKPRTALVRGF